MIALEVEIEAGDWARAGDVEALARRATEAAMACGPAAPAGDVAVALLLTDDEAVRDLNRAWRGQDRPTNVLSFPSPPSPISPRPLGDVALAFETVAREAAAEGKSVADHTAHLVIHGILHLLGHDHATEADGDRMEALEREALARLGIADPYREPA